jgi:hypothetical protein
MMQVDPANPTATALLCWSTNDTSSGSVLFRLRVGENRKGYERSPPFVLKTGDWRVALVVGNVYWLKSQPYKQSTPPAIHHSL